jgi:hypothetical protein
MILLASLEGATTTRICAAFKIEENSTALTLWVFCRIPQKCLISPDFSANDGMVLNNARQRQDIF